MNNPRSTPFIIVLVALSVACTGSTTDTTAIATTAPEVTVAPTTSI